jgi:hypothetical protein
MKFIPLKFIWLFLLPLLFWNNTCNNNDDANTRNLHVHIDGTYSAINCDYRNTNGRKPVTLYVYLQVLDPISGKFTTVTSTVLNNTNQWDEGFDLDYSVRVDKAYRVFVQAFQSCSYCCRQASSFCTQPASDLKDASLYFYGENTVSEYSSGPLFVAATLAQCDCRGC